MGADAERSYHKTRYSRRVRTGLRLRQAHRAGVPARTGANLNSANLNSADLNSADLTGVTWSNTICPTGYATNTSC